MKKSIISILSIGLIVLFSGCQKNVNTPLKPKIDPSIPMVSIQSIRHIPDITAIALEWKKVETSKAAGYYIIRANMQEDGKFKRIATVNSRFATHYLDTDLQANSKYAYKISVMTKKDFESRASDSLMVSTLPQYESVSLIESISNLPRQIKILWRPHPSKRVAEYIIEKTSPSHSKWEKIATVKNRLNVEYIDSKLGDNEMFMYRLKTVTFDGIESKYSKVVTARTKPLPGQITNQSGTKALPKKVQLSWEKSKTGDVLYYKIYRSSSATGSYSIIAKAPLSHNRYDDVISADNKIYFYKITTVDMDGLESKIDDVTPIMGSTLSKPSVPQITLAMIEGNKMVLNWSAGDKRAVSYNIYKVTKKDWSSSKEILIPNVQGLRFEDPDVVRGVEYGYKIQAIDRHGLISEKTKQSTLKLPVLSIKGQKN